MKSFAAVFLALAIATSTPALCVDATDAVKPNSTLFGAYPLSVRDFSDTDLKWTPLSGQGLKV